MKKFLLPLLVLIVGFNSCSEDFEIAAPYKEITVVYGILDTRNAAQYIRVQKAFMDENKSALTMARDADSSFYRGLRVQMRELNGSAIAATFELQRVDLIAEGFPKDTGAFFNTPSIAWKTTQQLNPDRRYRLVVTNTETGRADSAETEVIDSARSSFGIIQLDLQSNYFINFSRSTSNLLLSPTTPFPSSIKMMEGMMRFHVIDRNTVTGVETERTYDYTFIQTDSTQNNWPRIEASNAGFYSFLASELGPAPPNVQRYLDSPDVFIYAGTRELLRYQIFTKAQGGITGDQVRPIYTNIISQDGNALGLFAARTARVSMEVPLAPIVIDSLASNPQTSNLNIVGIYYR
jgi:hypothetical protein